MSIFTCETGMGKTTQIPQMLLEQLTAEGAGANIVCSEPRRIAAIAAGERVAAERGEECGGVVGYQVRLQGW